MPRHVGDFITGRHKLRVDYPASSLVHITGMEGRDSRLRKHSILDNNVWALTALKPFTARKGVHFKVSRAFGD
jgi:hypothetical protein